MPPNKEGKPIPADVPAGHKRDELNREITDQLAEEMEAAPEQAVDPSKLRHIDNEIAQPWVEQKKRERELGLAAVGLTAEDMNRAGVSNPVPGYYYKWLANEDFFRTSEARTAVRGALQEAQKWHFFPVTDAHDPDVAKEFKADGGLRRWGDVVLWAIHIEDWKKLEAHQRMRQQRQGAVEENYVNFGRQQLRGNGSAYDQSSDRMARYMGQEKMQPFTAKIVAEDDRNRR